MSTKVKSQQGNSRSSGDGDAGRGSIGEFHERIRMSAQYTLGNHECSTQLRELLTEIVESGATPERYERWSTLGEHAEELFRFTPGVLELAASMVGEDRDEDPGYWPGRFPELFGAPADVETKPIEIDGEEYEVTDPPPAAGESRQLPVMLYQIDDLPVLYHEHGLCQQGYRCPACSRWVILGESDAVRECSVEMKEGIGGDPDGLYVYHCAEAVVFIPDC